MAKKVQPIEVKLNIKGAEKISALKSSFRDLGKTVGLTDELIQSARKDIIDYGKTATQSEALIKGQIRAFEGLREQAEAGGNAYRGLSSDINELKARLIGSSSAIESQRKGLVSLGESANSSQSQIKRVIDKLIELRGQVRLDSESFRQLGGDISSLNAKFNQLTEEAEQLALAQKSLNQSVSASAGGASKQLQNIRSVTQSLREQREELGALSNEQELVQRRQRTGLQSLVDRGVKPSGRRSFEDVIATSALSFGEIKIEDLVPVKDLRAAEEEVKRILNDLQFQIEKSLSKGLIVSFQETARSARESARSLAQAFADPELLNILSRLDERIGELPKTTRGFNERIKELQQQLANTSRDADNYVEISLEIARVQREASATTQGLGAALVNDLETGVAVKNQRNLREAIAQLQAEMFELNVQTSEGSAKYAQNARQVNALQKALDDIANSYRNVRDMAKQSGAGGSPTVSARERERQEMERIAELQREINNTVDDYVQSLRSAQQVIDDYERKLGDDILERYELETSEQNKAFQQRLSQDEEAFKKELERVNILSQARKSAASALGFGGREDISSLYQEIIGLSTADIRRQQEMMGKSATEVFNDIVTAFEKGGRAVDLKSKSTNIGDDIAEGISKGASDSDEINKGAKSFAQKLIAAYKSVFGIRSPSKETEQKIGIPLGLGIIRGLLSAIRSSKREVQKEIEQIADPLIQKSRQPRRLIGTVNEPVATFTGFGTRARPATPGYRPLPARSQSLDTEIERLFNQFRVNIAAVTTDAEIYYNLLQSLPTSKITTDLANIASRRARAADVPGFIQAQRQIGPGELERAIASSVARYLKELRTPNPWVGVVGDYEEFIESVASKTKTLIRVREQLERFTNQKLLPGTRIAGLLPESRIGFAADKERLQRISQIGQTRALPPAERRFGELQNPGVSMFSPAGTAREYQKMARLLAEASSDLAAAKRYINEVGFENLPVEVTGFLGDELTQALKGYSLQARGLPAAGYPEVRGIFSSESQGFRGRQSGQFDFGGQRALPSSEILRGAVRALPPGVSREERFAERTRIANQRSRERSASVLEEDFFAGTNRNLLSAGGSGGSGGGRRGRIADDFGSASNELKSLKQEFGLFTNVSQRSTKNLREFASAIRFLQDDLDPLSGDFNKVNKQITDQSNLIERELQKRERQQRRRRPLSGGQFAQAAGAAISGGIFGGPEGFLGGVGGALVGGVGGAFTGAAFGAQLGGIRRQLGEFAAYAAQIEKLKISLKGITGSQEEYSRALAAAAGATEKLNVPQETAIQGITRLTAAVKGAGGGVADAELAFNSINSAIIATGGGAEQVEGAITALVQIFSKGKVSAEEINQIAERLPGTFNKIAEASGRTGPELTKALQDGTVGLNDLQKFLISLGSEYGDLAEKIANSSESAGARLQKSFDTLRKNVGDALQPVGAEFQNAFAEFIAEITPSLVESAKAIGRGLKFILENKEVIGFAATFALKVAAVNFALKAFAALNGPISSTFALLKTGFKATTQQASLAQTRLINFGNTVKALALSLAAPIVITFVVIGAQQVIAYFNRIKKARADLDKTFEAPRGVDYFKAIGGKAATRQKLLTEIGNITKASNILRERIETNKTSLQELQDTAAVTYGGAGSSGAAIADPSGPSREDLRTRIQADEAELQRLIDNYQELKRNLPKAKDERDALTQFPGPTIDTKTGGASRDAAIRDAERKAEEIAQLQRQLAQSNARKAILEIDKKISATRIAIVDAQDQQNFAAERALKGLLNTLEFERQKLEINSEYNAAVREIRETTEGQAAELREQIATQDSLIKSENLKLELKEKQISAQQDLNRLTKEQSKTFEEQFTDRQRQLGLISRDDFNKILLEREESRLRGIQGLRPEQRERGLEQLRQEIDPTPFEIVTKKVTELKDQLEDLTNIGNIVANSANAIGDAFSQSFTDIITGSKSTKEALSDFFKSVGSFFLDLAKQVIAKLIQIAILNAVTGLLPGLRGGGSGGAGNLLQGVNNPLKIADSSGFNLGGFFADGGRPPINKPSIVGERGPELFVPFQQGTIVSNEDLQEQMAKAGLPSMERSSSSRFRETREVMVPFTRSAEQLSAASAERETAQAISNPGPLDVRFESQVINNVEYVTADQYRKGMSQAAERGRALTLEALQNSVKARKRIGL